MPKLTTIMDIAKFSLKGYEITASVAKVYDGDSIHAVFPLPMAQGAGSFRWVCRIEGIDTPELRSKNPSERALAVEARDFLKGLILDKEVKLTLGDFDKYGRVLVNIFDVKEGKSYGEKLIERGLAKAYDGGKKEKWFV